MVRCVVVSDTHGNARLLARAISLARAGGRVDALIHLGDDHTDIEGFAVGAEEVLVVPGIHHPDYGSGAIPISLVHRLDGLTLALAHQPSDLPSLPRDSAARVLIHGHTHSLTLSTEPWGLRFNPGHLAGPIDRARPATFGVLEIADECLRIQGIASTGAVLLDSRWPLELLALGG